MRLKIAAVLAALVLAALFFVVSSIFWESGGVAGILFFITAAGAIAIAGKSLLRGRSWASYILIGAATGAVANGVMLGLIAFVGLSDGSSGWEELAALAASLLGAMAGAVFGGGVGAFLGWRSGNRQRSDGA